MKYGFMLQLAALAAVAQASHAQCEQEKLVASSQNAEAFGDAVDISGQFAVIGDPGEDIGQDINAGAAYVFRSTSMGWVEYARIVSNDLIYHIYDHFGSSVAIDDDTILVGAPQDQYPERRGAAFVFEFDGTNWVQTAKLTATAALNPAYFGYSVALEGDRALIGARGGNGGLGAAYIFERSGSSWTEIASLTASDGQFMDFLGESVSLSGGFALVGAIGDDALSGSAYLFDEAAGWAEVAKLVPEDPMPNKYFAKSVSISGDVAVIGAQGDSTLGDQSGAVYVFEKVSNDWGSGTKILAEDGPATGYFGAGVAIDNCAFVVGSPVGGPGSAYVYGKESGTWTFRAKLSSSDGVPGDAFGAVAAIAGDAILVGTLHGNGPKGNVGAAYVFQMPSFATPYCFGVGCPCGNDDPVLGGCANSIPSSDSDPQGALLAACGTASVVADDLVLSLSHLPPNQFGLFYMGGGEFQGPFGDGLRCVGSGGVGLFRYNPPETSGSAGRLTLGPGIVARSQSFSANGHIDAGETWYFQGWYRDPMGPCGTAFNLSNGLEVLFAP